MIEDEEDLVDVSWLMEIFVGSIFVLAAVTSVVSLNDSLSTFTFRGSKWLLISTFILCILIIGLGMKSQLDRLKYA